MNKEEGLKINEIILEEIQKDKPSEKLINQFKIIWREVGLPALDKFIKTKKLNIVDKYFKDDLYHDIMYEMIKRYKLYLDKPRKQDPYSYYGFLFKYYLIRWLS